MINIGNSVEENALGVNDDHEALVALTQTADKSGFATVASEKGVKPDGTRIIKEVELSDDYRLRVEQDAILFTDYPTGTALNTSIWSTRVTTQTVVVGSNRYELNSSGITTINTGSMLRTCRTFPWYKANALYVETALTWSLPPMANWFAEWGLFTATSAIAAITDGVFFRITAGQFRGVICNNSIESYVDLGALPTEAEVHDYVIEICQNTVYFWRDATLLGTIDVPATQFAPLGLAQCQYAVRTYNGAVIPASAIKLQVSAVQISNGGANFNRLWPTVRSGFGDGSYQIPTGAAAGQTANWTNSAAVAAIAAGSLTNVAASFTGLGGQFRFGAPAGADTDFHIMKYQVPVGKTLVVRGVSLDAFNQGAAVATTPTTIQWAVGVGSTADTLAGTEDAIGTKIRRIIPLGITSWLVGALIGQSAPTIYRNYDAPLVIHGGEHFSIIAKVILGTATASQEIRGQVMVNGYFE